VAVPHLTIANTATVTFFVDLASMSLANKMPESYEVKDLSEEGIQIEHL